MNKPAPPADFQSSIADEALALLRRLGVPSDAVGERGMPARSPITGEVVTHVRETSPGGGRAPEARDPPGEEAAPAPRRAAAFFLLGRRGPAPRRGEFVRLLGE